MHVWTHQVCLVDLILNAVHLTNAALGDSSLRTALFFVLVMSIAYMSVQK